MLLQGFLIFFHQANFQASRNQMFKVLLSTTTILLQIKINSTFSNFKNIKINFYCQMFRNNNDKEYQNLNNCIVNKINTVEK